jgi:hypothetical protein
MKELFSSGALTFNKLKSKNLASLALRVFIAREALAGIFAV